MPRVGHRPRGLLEPQRPYSSAGRSSYPELVGLGDLSDGLEGGEVGTLEVDVVDGILVFDFDHLDLPILAFEGKEFFGGGFPDALLFHS